MKTNQLMFLYAAEELNFTKAAKKAFVSQQCLSNHIARLECEYNVKLFERKPRRLELTWAGRELYHALMRIKKIEDSITNDMLSNGADTQGTVTVGMPSSRASLLVAPMVAAFNRLYPKVTVNVILRETNVLLDLLDASKIDFLIGIDVSPTDYIEETVLTHERCLLYISDILMQRYLPGIDPSPETTLSADVITSLPLSGMPDDAMIKLKVMSYLSARSIPLKEFCTVDNYTTLMMLAKNHVSAFIGSECVLWSDFFRMLRKSNSHDKIYAFPIEGFDSKMKISLVHAKDSVHSVYTRDLIKLTKSLYQHDAYLNYLKSKK